MGPGKEVAVTPLGIIMVPGCDAPSRLQTFRLALGAVFVCLLLYAKELEKVLFPLRSAFVRASFFIVRAWWLLGVAVDRIFGSRPPVRCHCNCTLVCRKQDFREGSDKCVASNYSESRHLAFQGLALSPQIFSDMFPGYRSLSI